MEGKDNIKELFSQKLGNYEAKVNPELWAKISSQVAAGATTTVATGISMFAKIAIGIGISAAVIATVVVINSNDAPIENTTPKQGVSNQAQAAEPQSEEMAPANQTVNTNSTKSTALKAEAEAQQPNPTLVQTSTRVFFPEMDKLNPRDIGKMPTSTKEPTIIQGITYSGMTNYGGAPSNQPADLDQIAKPQPIKKYPNVFTPNGDKENDLFFLESEGLTDFSIVVFDPKGDIVFTSADPAFTWNGMDMRTGELVSEGNYMYMVSTYDSEGNPFPIYEQLAIKR